MKGKIIALVLFVVVFLVAGVWLVGSRSSDSSPVISGGVEFSGEIKEFNLTARQWEFIPSTISVSQGDLVRLNITSVDVAHGIALADFGISQRLEPGQTTTIEFVANQSGRFSFFCNVLCGVGHGAMRGVLVVN